MLSTFHAWERTTKNTKHKTEHKRHKLSAKKYAPGGIHERVRDRRGGQTAGLFPGPAVKGTRNRCHQSVFVIWNRWTIIQVRCAKDDRCEQQAEHRTSGFVLKPILNEPAKQQLFGNRSKQKKSGKRRRSDDQLPHLKTVTNKVNRDSKWDRYDGK